MAATTAASSASGMFASPRDSNSLRPPDRAGRAGMDRGGSFYEVGERVYLALPRQYGPRQARPSGRRKPETADGLQQDADGSCARLQLGVFGDDTIRERDHL